MNKRLHYYDMLKGIAILLVVMWHVIALGIREIDSAFLFKVIGCVHMPLFFFVSGWFSCRINHDNGVLRAPSLYKRFLQLIVPLVVVSSLWVWYFPHSGLECPFGSTFADLWHDETKNGYWFTLCLFEISLVFAAVLPLFRKSRSLIADIVIAIVIWVVLQGVSIVMNAYPLVRQTLELDLISRYWVPFIIGFLASRHREVFNKLICSPAMLTVAMLLLVPTLYYECYYWEFEWLVSKCPWVPYLNKNVMYICLAIVAVALVKPWGERAYSSEASLLTRRIADFWCLLGRKSLAIYLLHYFFLFPMGSVRPALEALNLAFVPAGVFAFVVAICIIGAVLIVEAIIEKSPLLSLLLTGNIPNKLRWKRNA